MSAPTDLAVLEVRAKQAITNTIKALLTAPSQKIPMNGYSEQFVTALTQIAYAHIEQTAIECERFAKHAKRSKIMTADLKLCARKNIWMVEELERLEKR